MEPPAGLIEKGVVWGRNPTYKYSFFWHLGFEGHVWALTTVG